MTAQNNSVLLEDDKILILGCGLSGMLLALAFANLGINTIIIEQKSIKDSSFFNDIRTTAITDTSRIFLNEISIWKQLKKVVGEIKDIYVIDNKAPEMLHFVAGQTASDAMGYIIKNSDFKKILLASILQNKHITLLDKQTYRRVDSKPDGGDIYLENGELINYKLLIVAEGHNSRVKKTYFTKDMHKYYGQTALTFIVTHDKSHECTAVEHFMPGGPFAILPLQNLNQSSIVWTLDDKQGNIIKNLPIDEFEYLVQQNFGSFLGDIKVTSQIAAYPLKAYLTHKYFYERIILIADSAHIIHPLAGQGLNMGIKDIITLISLVKDQGISLTVLKQYQSKRQIDNKAMYLITDNLNRLFSNYSKTLWALRRTGMKITNHFTFLKSHLVKYAMGKRFF